VISNSKQSKPGAGLAKGQVWRLTHVYIQIVELGKRLLEYRMLDSLNQRGVRSKMSSIEVMAHYLQSRHARLVTASNAEQ
jgi:hypothetical protein